MSGRPLLAAGEGNDDDKPTKKELKQIAPLFTLLTRTVDGGADGGADGADGVTCRAVLAGFEPHNLDGYPYFLVHEDGDSEARPSIHTRHTFSLNLKLDRGKYVFFIGCER